MPTSGGYPVEGVYLTPVEITCLIIATTLCAIRLYSRLAIQGKRHPSIDDYFVCVALLCAYIVTSTHIIAEQSYNLGRHHSDVSDYHISQIFLIQFISEWAFPVGNACVKLSILSFYLTFLSKETFPKLRKTVYFVMGFIVLWSLGLSIVITVSCIPVRRWWRTDIPGTCINDMALGTVIFVQQAMNLISDLLVFLLPIKTLWVLQTSRGKKIRMVVLLGLGFIVCLVALIRIPVILALLLRTDHDISWYTYPFFVTAAVELDLTIACACVPFCRPVAHRVAPAIKRFSHSFSSHYTSSLSTRTRTDKSKSRTRTTTGGRSFLSTFMRTKDTRDDVEMGNVEDGRENGEGRERECSESTDGLRMVRTNSTSSQELVAQPPVEAERVLIVPVRKIRRMESLEMAITQSPTHNHKEESST